MYVYMYACVRVCVCVVDRSGSVVECLTRDPRAAVRASQASLRCVLELDPLILA